MNQTFFSYRYNQILATIVLVGLILALAAFAWAKYQEAQTGLYGPTTINVMGEGVVQARPDVGTFSFAVRAEGETAAAAQTASAEAMNEILEYLESAGVAEEDIKTQNYNLNQQYRYEERVCPAGNYCPPGEQIPDGFEVYQNVQVKVRDLDQSGELIAGVGERGATNISSLQFTIDDESELKAEARSEAIADAREKAEALARDLDMRLGEVINFYENQEYPHPYYMERSMGGDMAMNESASPSLPTGESDVRVNVSITYELK